MLVMAMMTGDPNRVIKGWDVAGNVCGQPNKKISGVPWSGLDMTNRPYETQRFMFIASLVKALFRYIQFELMKTAVILGGDALAKTMEATNLTFADVERTDDEKIAFCLGGDRQ